MMRQHRFQFPPCDQPIGLYPVIDDIDLIPNLVQAGIKTIQLRCKNSAIDQVKLKAILNDSTQASLQLFINDDWQLAIAVNAYGVHLGQTDLQKANLNIIAENNLRLGISAYTKEEVEYANQFNPSYISIGPVFKKVKDKTLAPLGLQQFSQLVRYSKVPIVAIGGITLENCRQLLELNVSGLALKSPIINVEKPAQAIQAFLQTINQYYSTNDVI